jgi:hypothetical protein
MSAISAQRGPQSWPSNNLRALEIHPAFYGPLTEDHASAMLSGHPPYTYILRNEGSNQLFLSFVNDCNIIEHLLFSKKGSIWFGQNGDPHIENSVRALVPDMMHCQSQQCRMLPRLHSFIR